MLDIKWIINNPEKADKAFKRRGLKPLSKKLIKMSQSRSQVFVKLENLLKQRNNLSKEISNIKNKSKKNALIKNDQMVEKCYQDELFTNDLDRLKHLLKLYLNMTGNLKRENEYFDF